MMKITLDEIKNGKYNRLTSCSESGTIGIKSCEDCPVDNKYKPICWENDTCFEVVAERLYQLENLIESEFNPEK